MGEGLVGCESIARPPERVRGVCARGAQERGEREAWYAPGAGWDRGFVRIHGGTDPPSPRSVDALACACDGMAGNQPFGHPRPAQGPRPGGFVTVGMGPEQLFLAFPFRADAQVGPSQCVTFSAVAVT